MLYPPELRARYAVIQSDFSKIAKRAALLARHRQPAARHHVAKAQQQQNANHNMPPPTTTLVRMVLCRRCMKNSATNIIFTTAMNSASHDVKRPQVDGGHHGRRRGQNQQRHENQRVSLDGIDVFVHVSVGDGRSDRASGNRKIQMISTKCQYKPPISTGV